MSVPQIPTKKPSDSYRGTLEPREEMYLKASEFIGLTEIPGEKNNPQILTFFKEIGHTWVQNDEVAWCSAFINWVSLQCGCERSGKLDARSWLDVGKKAEEPLLGHVVVFWRVNPSSWEGHVGLYAGEDSNYIHCLGGNQSNQVRVTRYPKSQVLGYRELNYI